MKQKFTKGFPGRATAVLLSFSFLLLFTKGTVIGMNACGTLIKGSGAHHMAEDREPRSCCCCAEKQAPCSGGLNRECAGPSSDQVVSALIPSIDTPSPVSQASPVVLGMPALAFSQTDTSKSVSDGKATYLIILTLLC